MKTRCIVILAGTYINEQNYERFGIKRLHKDVKILVYDMRKYLGRDTSRQHCEVAVNKVKIRDISNRRQLIKNLENDKPDYGLDFIGLHPGTSHIIRTVRKSNCKYIFQSTGCIPKIDRRLRFQLLSLEIAKNPILSIQTLGSYWFWSRILKGSHRRVKSFLLKEQQEAPDISLLAGKASLNNWTKRSTEILWVPSQDSHTFINKKNSLSKVVDIGYAVFIDDDLPNSKDKELTRSPVVDASKYYKQMNDFFTYVEALFDIRVIIASKPTADTATQRTSYRNRLCIQGKTAELVNASSFVIAHGSTAISYAVLSKKPILLVSNKEVNKTSYSSSIKAFAQSLSKEVIDTECRDCKAITKSFEVASSIYDEYEKQYLSTRGYEKDVWDILLEHIYSER